jgi:hypothetical protein
MPISQAQPAASRRPVKKVAAAGAAGGSAVFVIFIAAQLGIDLPVEVANSVVAIVAFAAGYLKKS